MKAGDPPPPLPTQSPAVAWRRRAAQARSSCWARHRAIMKPCTDIDDFGPKYATAFEKSPVQMPFDDLARNVSPAGRWAVRNGRGVFAPSRRVLLWRNRETQRTWNLPGRVPEAHSAAVPPCPPQLPPSRGRSCRGSEPNRVVPGAAPDDHDGARTSLSGLHPCLHGAGVFKHLFRERNALGGHNVLRKSYRRDLSQAC